MLKFSLLICIGFLVFYSGSAAVINNNDNSQWSFGSFLGSCPDVKGVPRSIFEDSEDEWYTHRVLGDYSPWKYMRCQSTKFDFKSGSTPSIKTTFLPPILPISFQMTGEIRSSNPGEYTVHYAHKVFGDISKKMIPTQDYGSTVVMWNCWDFKFFHLESIEVLSKSSSDSTNTAAINRASQASARRLGISSYPNPFTEIDQQSCK